MGPLSEKLRPKTFENVVGQSNVVKSLQTIVQSKSPLSILLFGPPGSGKTTLARIYLESFGLPFLSLSGVVDTTSEIKKRLQERKANPLFAQKMLVFVDEIHRFNRAQQDLFLPFLEEGSLILVGATTENPSFVLNNALLSRLRVFTLNPLKENELEHILLRYEKSVSSFEMDQEKKKALLLLSQGDARHLLNLLENLEKGLDLQKKPPLYDRDQEGHYRLISALHKAVRGSDPDAALYWLIRMLEAGEDPLYITRRVIRMASEDVGLADPNALTIALNAHAVYEKLGSPEGELAIAQAVIYLSLAPKSNAAYLAYKKGKSLAEATGHLDPPKEIINAPTQWMKEEGYGKDYLYDHDFEAGFSGANYFPEGIDRPSLYEPVARGFEREMQKRLAYFQRLRLHQSKL